MLMNIIKSTCYFFARIKNKNPISSIRKKDLKINALFHSKGKLFSKYDYYIYSSIVTI